MTIQPTLLDGYFKKLELSKDSLIFLIDDNEIDNLVSKKILEKFYGFRRVVVFNKSIEVFEILTSKLSQQGHPNLIFLDIAMPILDGFQFIEKLEEVLNQQKMPIIPIAVLSSSNNYQDREKMEKFASVIAVCSKPLSDNIIKNFIDIVN